MLPITLENEVPPEVDIKEILKQRKKTLDLFREILPSLQQTGKDLLTEDHDIAKYSAFMVNRAMSKHIDCLAVATVMNQLPGIPARSHYLVYLNTIRKYKRRFVKWKDDGETKKLENVEEKASLISAYCGFSMRYARTVTHLYSDEVLAKMEKQMEKGG